MRGGGLEDSPELRAKYGCKQGDNCKLTTPFFHVQVAIIRTKWFGVSLGIDLPSVMPDGLDPSIDASIFTFPSSSSIEAGTTMKFVHACCRCCAEDGGVLVADSNGTLEMVESHTQKRRDFASGMESRQTSHAI